MKWDIEKYKKFSQMQFKIGKINLENLNPKPGEQVLDLGCGIGNLTAILSEKVRPGKVIGIDIDKNMVNSTRELISKENITNIEIKRISGTNISYQNEFDAVYSNIVIHWIKDLQLLFDKLYDALKEEGRLSITAIYTDPNTPLETEISEDRQVKISQIELKLMQEFVEKQLFNGIMTMEEFLEYQPKVNKNIVYKTHTIKELKNFLEDAKFREIKIEKKYFEHAFNDVDLYFDYRSSNLWIYYLSYFPPKYRTQIAQRIKSLILKEWNNIPESRRVLPVTERWPVAFIQAKK